jgi:large conductance mechanosensitive channel
MLKGFKEFILRGNVIDLAVGVVIGGAFGAIVSSLVADIITPLIGAIAKVPDFSAWAFTVNNSKFMIGSFINHLIAFLLVAASIYFFVVVPMNMLLTKMKKAPAPADPTDKKCPECLSTIPLDAKRCAFCAQPV